MVGDFNFPTVKWDGEWSGIKNNMFVECVKDAFLTQMVFKPTRGREEQTPDLLDLALVSEMSLVSDIIHLNPTAKSDHETLLFSLYIHAPMPADGRIPDMI